MKVIGNADILGAIAGAFKEYDDYPLNPKVGTWALIRKSLMMCISVSELPVWIPLSPERNTKLFEQETPSDRWVVDHKLGSDNVLIQCFDQSGKVIMPSEINPIDSMSTEIVLPEAMTGKVVAMFGYTDGVSTNAPDSGGAPSALPKGFDYQDFDDYPIDSMVTAWFGSGKVGQSTKLYITGANEILYGADMYGNHSSGKYLKGTWVLVGYVGSYGNVSTGLFRRVE